MGSIPGWFAAWSLFCFAAGALSVILAAIVYTGSDDR